MTAVGSGEAAAVHKANLSRRLVAKYEQRMAAASTKGG